MQRSPRTRIRNRRLFQSFESLEPRTMLCILHQLPDARELRPDLLQQALKQQQQQRMGKKGGAAAAPSQMGPPADIIWTNRGLASDNFAATFGTSAELARGVVDAVIVMYERMIGSFNYSDGSATFNLTLSMSGGGFGAGAGTGSTVGGKPKSASITMGTGSNDGDPNSTNGWFMDPTPFDNSEFLGTIQNEFTANATSGGPASGKNDFLTVVEAEMTHAVGQWGNLNALWNAMTTNTGQSDTAHPGTLYVFRGASIKHLLTSDNGGGASSFAGVHTTDPQSVKVFEGDSYSSTDDQGNAFYEGSRRYLVDNIHSLMFKDAYAYSSIDPAIFGTMYNVLNQTTGVVTVRGGDSVSGRTNSSDNIIITRNGNTITISEDIGNDVAATGALPSEGNLPAFVTQYDISQVNSITLSLGDGNDTISIGAGIGVPISITSGTGTDTVTVAGTTAAETFNVTSNTVSGAVTINSLSGVENLIINTDDGGDTVNFNASGATLALTVDGAGGDDSFTGTNGSNTTINFSGGAGTNQVNVLSGSFVAGSDFGAGNTIMNATINGAGATLASNASQHLTSLSIAGASARMTMNANGNRILTTSSLSIDPNSTLDLNDNDAVIEYSGSSPLASIESMIATGRNGGAWNGNGMTSTTAGTFSVTSLAAIEGSDYIAMNGNVFSGETIDNTSIVIKYTYYGDANLNGQVDGSDYALIDAAFNSEVSTQTNIGGWLNGDFDYNDIVDGADYARIDSAFQSQLGIL